MILLQTAPTHIHIENLKDKLLEHVRANILYDMHDREFFLVN